MMSTAESGSSDAGFAATGLFFAAVFATIFAAYAVQIGIKIYVLHVFQKKSKSGIATPKTDIDLIKKRFKEALERAKNDQT